MNNAARNQSVNNGRKMKFTKTFITSKKGAGRIHPFFHKHGYKLVKDIDSQYWFRRGSPFAFLNTSDIKKYPTRVKIELTVANNTIHHVIDYRINTTAAITLKNDKDTIMAEMNKLEDYLKLN